MKKEKQTPITVSLQSAIELKKAGWEKKTFLAYNYWSDGDYRLYFPWIHELGLDYMGVELEEIIYAPTIVEMLPEIPEFLEEKWYKYGFFIHQYKWLSIADYFNFQFVDWLVGYEDKNSSNALAKLWVRCKQNWHI